MRSVECPTRRVSRRPSSASNPAMRNDVAATAAWLGRPSDPLAARSGRRGNPGKRRSGTGIGGGRRRFGWRDDDRREEEGDLPAIDTIQFGVRRERQGRVQRVRVARVRVRERCDPPSCRATRSTTIRVPTDTIRVPSGSISVRPSGAIGKCRDQTMRRNPLPRHRPKVRELVRRMTYSGGPDRPDRRRRPSASTHAGWRRGRRRSAGAGRAPTRALSPPRLAG